VFDCRRGAPVTLTPGAQQVPAPDPPELRRETGQWRPCFKPVMINIAGRARFGILRGWLRVPDGWLCQVEYMNNGEGSTEG
jgi:hypothetical protein